MLNFGEKTENLVDSTEKPQKVLIFQFFKYFFTFLLFCTGYARNRENVDLFSRFSEIVDGNIGVRRGGRDFATS